MNCKAKICFLSSFHNEDRPLRKESIQLYNLCCDNTNNLQCRILLPHKYCGTFQINKPFTTELFLFTYQHSFEGGEQGDIYKSRASSQFRAFSFNLFIICSYVYLMIICLTMFSRVCLNQNFNKT